MKMLKGGPVGAVGTVRSFMNVVKDIDFEEARVRAESAPTMLVLAPTEELAHAAVDQLFGKNDPIGVTVRSWDNARSDFDPTRYDVVIVYDPHGDGLFDEVRIAAGSRRDTSHIFFLSANLSDGADPVKDVRFEVLEMLPDMAPAFGRFHPLWRKAAVQAIIDQTSRANAQFALVSNIPAIVPFLGGLISASADLLVLTKNQVMMCYKIAAAHDQDLENHLAIIRELTPVVGAGFLWRTAARQAATFVPFAAGTIPKVAIAFAGTLTMGKAAEYYYQYGSKPSRSQLEKFKVQALEMASKLPIAKGIVGDSADHANVIEGAPAREIKDDVTTVM